MIRCRLFSDIFTLSLNQSGCVHLEPCGFAGGLPIAYIVCNAYDERQSCARLRYEQATDCTCVNRRSKQRSTTTEASNNPRMLVSVKVIIPLAGWAQRMPPHHLVQTQALLNVAGKRCWVTSPTSFCP
jgi:hypothetical protein